MSENHKPDSTGLLQDGTRTKPATPEDIALYDQAQHVLRQWEVPALLHAYSPHERLYIVNFDGTGNDAVHDFEHVTNIGLFSDQLQKMAKTNPHIGVHYEPGPGTQNHLWQRVPDSALGYTYDARIEKVYEKVIKKAYAWLKEDPQADIHILVTGFSRGAEQAAGFTRLIHERGIQDWTGEFVQHHLTGPDTVTYTKPPLVPPGKVMQAVVLLDPVGTGIPHDRNRRLPPSVVSGLQITARDERRDAFPSTDIIPQGVSADGRFLGVTVPGAHSDIGGGYHLNGLSTLNFNLAADVINAYSDAPLLHKRALPQDPHMYVIHHSEDHQWFYSTKDFARHGLRDLRGAQVSAPDCRITIKCDPPEPLAPALAAQLPARAPVTIGPLPAMTVSTVKRDVAYANAQTVREQGPLPPGGLPVQVERKPNPLPAPAPTHTRERTSAPAVPPHPAEPAHAAHTLQAGDHGPAVQSLQNHLRNLGYTDMRGRPLPADGHYGPITQIVVQGFQQEHGLAVDGRAGPQTQAALQRQTQHTHAPIMARHASAPVTAPSTPTHTESQASAQSARQAADEAARAAQQVRLQQQIAHQHRVAAEEKDAAQRATEERIFQQRAAEPAPIPDHLRDFRHASHPLHGTYADVLDAVHAMEDDRQIPHGPESEKLAATLTYRIATTRFEDGPAHASPLFHAVDRVDMRDRDTIVAIEPRVNYALAPKEVSVSIKHALSQSVPQTSETWARQAMPHLFEPAPAHARTPAVDVARLPDYDLRRPDHPQHRAYQTLRERVAQVYARDGVPVSDDHLERATAALAVERQRLEIGEPSTLRLIHQPHTGNTGAQSLLVMSESLPNGYSLEAEVTAKAMQVPPEQSYQQLAQVIQQQSVEQQQLLQQARGAARTL